MRLTIAYPLAAALALSGCGQRSGSDNKTADANHISEDPYGATGAPGADLTDNGVTDGANGLADTNRSDGNAVNLAEPLREE